MTGLSRTGNGLILIICSLLPLYLCLSGLITGSVYLLYSYRNRNESPFGYWYGIALNGVPGLGILAYGVYEMLSGVFK